MEKKLKNISIFGFAFILALAMLLWLYQTKKGSQSNIQTSNSQQQQENSAAKLPTSQTETNSDSNSSVTAAQLPEIPPLLGTKTDSSDVLKKYGGYAFEAFDKNPDLVSRIKTVYPSFETRLMYVSFPSHVYRLNNGKDYLALGGCLEHNCGGTGLVVFYNLTDDKIFLGKESMAQIDFEEYYGDPSDDEKNAMLNYYFEK